MDANLKGLMFKNQNPTSDDINKSDCQVVNAQDFYESGYFIEALDIVSNALEINDQNSKAWHLNSLINLELKDLFIAEACINRALLIEDNKTYRDTRSRIILTEATELYELKDYDLSIQKLNLFFSIVEDKTSEEYGYASMYKGIMLYNNKDLKESLYYTNEALKIFPDDDFLQSVKQKCLFSLGNYFYKLKEFDASLEKLDELLSLIDPDDDLVLCCNILNNKARVLYAAGYKDEAKNCIDNALEIVPEEATETKSSLLYNKILFDNNAEL